MVENFSTFGTASRPDTAVITRRTGEKEFVKDSKIVAKQSSSGSRIRTVESIEREMTAAEEKARSELPKELQDFGEREGTAVIRRATGDIEFVQNGQRVATLQRRVIEAQPRAIAPDGIQPGVVSPTGVPAVAGPPGLTPSGRVEITPTPSFTPGVTFDQPFGQRGVIGPAQLEPGKPVSGIGVSFVEGLTLRPTAQQRVIGGTPAEALGFTAGVVTRIGIEPIAGKLGTVAGKLPVLGPALGLTRRIVSSPFVAGPLAVLAGVQVVAGFGESEVEGARRASLIASDVVAISSFLRGVPERGLGDIFARLDPRFTPVEVTPEGTQIIQVAEGPPVEVVTRTPTEPLTIQAARAGEPVRPVTAARDLFGPRVTEVTVEKPIPEGGPQLERSLFADPLSRLRPSRLGIVEQPEADIADLLSGEFTIRRVKPQAVIFPEAPAERFPKELSDVEVALRAGRGLTPQQQSRLLEFQLKPSGEFKPVGFTSVEAEVTLAPGEVIEIAGPKEVTKILGRKVEIIPAEVKGAPEVEVKVEVSELGPRVSEQFQKAVSSSLREPLPLLRLPLLFPATTAIEFISSRPPPFQPIGISFGIPSEPILEEPSVLPSPEPSPTPSPIIPPSPSPTPRGGSRPVSPPPPPPSISPISLTSPISGPPSPPVSPPSGPPSAPPSIVLPPVSPIPTIPRPKLRARLGETLVDVFVGLPGRKVQFGRRGLSVGEAIRFGRRGVTETAAATVSFSVEGAPVSGEVDEEIKRGLGSKFRRAKKPVRGKFVQKREERISTLGELREITFKGLEARRRKSNVKIF